MDTLQIDRNQASSVNPIISSVGATDTMSHCARLVDQLGVLLSKVDGEEAHDMSALYLLTSTISAALTFEVGASS